MDLRRSLANRIPYAAPGHQSEMRAALSITRAEDLAALGASWERLGWLAPKITRPSVPRTGPRKEDTPERRAWREQKARRRALLRLL